MGKYKFTDPNYKPKNTCDSTECNKIYDNIEEALDSNPIDSNKFEEAMYILTSQSFKYPSVEKCGPNCTAPQNNRKWAKALDMLKTIQYETDIEKIHETFELSRLILEDGKGYFK